MAIKLSVMKGLINKIFSAVVAALAMVSCVQSDEMLLEDVLGDWYYESAEADMPLQIYVSFAKDRSFQLFQKDGEGAFRRYVGTYTYDGTVLDGVYSDKVQWKEAKMVSREGDILVLKGVDSGETISYVRKTIPATVRYHYSDAFKSMADEEPVLWL